LKDAIWRLKYGSVKGIATVLADLAEAKYGQFIIEKRFLITSAPMTKQRIRFRGFNQAEEIAKALAKRTNMLYLPSLSKLKDTGSQVGRSRRERLRSLSGTFEANITPDQNKKILVVDDVYTSGATLEESARALRAVGFREVWGLTITRD
jgi:competence protein ComFC